MYPPYQQILSWLPALHTECYDTARMQLLYNLSQITRVLDIFQTSGQSTPKRITTIRKKPSPRPRHPASNISGKVQLVSSNGPNQKRLEAKKVKSHPEFHDKRRLRNHPRSRPSVDAQYQTNTNPTAQPSTSSAASERGTPAQQRASGNPPFFAGITAYTQYGVAETFGPDLQRPSGDKLSAYASTIEHRDLPGASAQTFSTGSIQHGHHTARAEETFACPYHRPILFQEYRTNPRSGQGLGPMDRYLAEGPSDRYAILNQPEAGNVATNNGCRCMEVMQRNMDTDGRVQK